MEQDKSVTHYPNGAVRPEHAAPVPNNVREGVGAFAAYIALRDCRWELARLLRQTERLVYAQQDALSNVTEYEQRFREVAKAEDPSNPSFRNG